MPDSNSSSARQSPAHRTAELSEILVASLRALAEAGEPETASKLAARACAVLRREDRVEWSRFNKLLHWLSPRTGPIGAPQPRS